MLYYIGIIATVLLILFAIPMILGGVFQLLYNTVDTIVVGRFVSEDALAAMAENGTVWVPTLSTIGNLRGKGRFSEDAVCRILDSAMENVSRFAAMDGLIAPGSDAGAWAVEHAVDSEWTLLTQAIGSDAKAVLDQGAQRIQEKF